MAAAAKRLQIIVLPLWRRHWAFYARAAQQPQNNSSTDAATTLSATTHESSSSSSSARQKVQGLVERVTESVQAAMARRWDQLKAAQPGTATHVVRRVAERLVDQVPPEERFLASARRAERAEVVYPSSLPERLVRRRLRVVWRNARFHRRWATIWGLATPLLFPLVLTPVSNVPLVYAAWRWWGHRNAAQGCRALESATLEYRACDDLAALVEGRAWAPTVDGALDGDADAPALFRAATGEDRASNHHHRTQRATGAGGGEQGLADTIDGKLRWLRLHGHLK